ncbi:MAG: hypothetical protein ACM3JB_25785 [Acidobacteriaceae bacterium]
MEPALAVAMMVLVPVGDFNAELPEHEGISSTPAAFSSGAIECFRVAEELKQVISY